MSIVDKLVHKCRTDGIISEQDEEIVRFGIDNLINLMLCIGILVCVGSIFGSWKNGLIFFLFFFPLRKYAGGYHSNTKTKCVVSSVVLLFAMFCILYIKRWHSRIYLILFCIFHLLIFCLVPVGNQNKILDVLEKRVYRRKTYIVLAFEDLFFIFSYLMNYNNLIILITMVYATVGLLLILGVIKNWYVMRRLIYKKEMLKD